MNKIKRTAAILLCTVLASCSVMSGCRSSVNNHGEGSEGAASGTSTSSGGITLPEDGGFKTVSISPSDDKYRTFYEIFPYSFYDSDGNGIGDLKGITSKLDYLNDGNPDTTDDLGVEGIWLMPIMPSPSYHKYNVTDYRQIDPSYGTLDDFKELLSEAHKRNINVIIDFVINHSSKSCEWYQKAIEELKAGKTDGYAQYYHFSQKQETNKWLKSAADGWFYEAEFDSDMPDLNLRNEDLRRELEDIVKYWLDMGVDGFRLDAVMWYEASGKDGSIEDLKWLYDYAKTVKSDVYMIGECWTDFNSMSEYYKAGIDSYFNFDEQGATGTVAKAVKKGDALSYVKDVVRYQDTIAEKNPDGINTPFISNHDTPRSAGFLTNDTYRKMAAAMYIVAPGNPYIYYGEEIAMTGYEKDEDKRKGMLWDTVDSEGYVKKIPGSINKDLPEKSVKQSLEDENSLLSFYKRAIRLKSQNPEIARGKASVVDFGQNGAAGLICDYNGSKVMVIYNSSDSTQKVNIKEDQFTFSEVRGYLLADSGDTKASSGGGSVNPLLGGGSTEASASEASAAAESSEFVVEGKDITLPPYSVIVIK